MKNMMTKISVMVKLVTLVLSLTVVAQAELLVTNWRVEATEDGSPAYYVTYASETGEAHEYSVSEGEFYAAVEEYAAARKPAEEDTNEEPRPWIASVVSTLTFWNPDD